MDMQPIIWIHMAFPENCGTPDRGKQRMTHEWWFTLIKKGQNWGDQSPCRTLSRLEMLAGDEAVCPSRKRWALLASTGYILMRWLFVLFLSCTPTKKCKGTMWAYDWKDLYQISAIYQHQLYISYISAIVYHMPSATQTWLAGKFSIYFDDFSTYKPPFWSVTFQPCLILVDSIPLKNT